MNIEKFKDIKTSLINIIEKIDNDIKQEENNYPLLQMDYHDRLDYVVDFICDYGRISYENLCKSGGRFGEYMKWRKITCYICSQYCKTTEEDIANKLKYKNRVSVNHHINQMEDWINYPEFAPDDLLQLIKNVLKKLGYEKE